jgi:hypothetical protein
MGITLKSECDKYELEIKTDFYDSILLHIIYYV